MRRLEAGDKLPENRFRQAEGGTRIPASVVLSFLSSLQSPASSLIFFLLICLSCPSAQPEFESPGPASDFTVEIDTVKSKNIGKSVLLALGLSAIVPGGGEIYLNEKKQAKPFLLIEAGFWGALVFAVMARDSYLQSARNTASKYAGIDASQKDEDFLMTMTRYRSYREIHHRQDSYEQIQILSGIRDQDYDIPPEPGNYWDFGTPLDPANTQHWNAYIASTKAYGRAKVMFTWSIGGLVIGRIISLVHTLQLHRTTTVKGLSEGSPGSGAPAWTLTPVIQPGFAGADFRVCF